MKTYYCDYCRKLIISKENLKTIYNKDYHLHCFRKLEAERLREIDKKLIEEKNDNSATI